MTDQRDHGDEVVEWTLPKGTIFMDHIDPMAQASPASEPPMQITNELIELVCAECAARPGVERNWPGDFTAEELEDSRQTVRIGLEAAVRVWKGDPEIAQAQAEAAARTADYLREG